MKLIKVLAQSQNHTNLGNAEDNLAGMKGIPGYKTGTITKERNKYITTGYFDIQDKPILRSKQREAWIEDITYKEN